jgi:hypothetical protein
MSKRRSLSITFSMLFVVLLLPAAASAQYTRDDVFEKLSDGFGRGYAAPIVEGMPQGMPVRLEFPELSLSRNVGRNQNATAVLEQVFKRIRPKIFVPRPGWDQQLEKSKADVTCILRAQWRVEIDGKSQLRELYITLRNDDDEWRVISIRSAPPEQ